MFQNVKIKNKNVKIHKMNVNLDVGILKKLNFCVNKCAFDNFVIGLGGF